MTALRVARWSRTCLRLGGTALVLLICALIGHPSERLDAKSTKFAYVTHLPPPGDPMALYIIKSHPLGVVSTLAVEPGQVNGGYGIAVSPDGDFAYTTHSAEGAVSVISLDAGTVEYLPNAASTPLGVTISPDGGTLYVAAWGTDSVLVVDTETRTVTASWPVGDGPTYVAVNNAGNRLYVTNYVDSSLSVVDTSSGAVLATITGGDPTGLFGPQGLAVAPDDSAVYVANSGRWRVTAVDTATNTIRGALELPYGCCHGISVTPGGSFVIAAGGTSDKVFVIDADSLALKATVQLSGRAYNVGVAPDGDAAYVSLPADNAVTVLSTSSWTPIQTIPVGPDPTAIGFRPIRSKLKP